MPRISVITGAASGIGKATKELLEQRGERVIGVDIHDAEVVADLSTAEGRSALVDAVRKVSGGSMRSTPWPALPSLDPPPFR